MGLLDDIQHAAVDANSDLGQLLRQCKLLAARLDSKPLEDWLIWEANGYPPEANLPDYRIWALPIVGHFAGPFQSGIRNAPIPKACIPVEVREAVTRFRCRESVATIQDLLQQKGDGMYRHDLGDLALLLGDKVYDGMNCISAWGTFGRANLVEVLNSVRNGILDFALALRKEDPKAGDIDSRTPMPGPERVNQIFNTTVYDGSATIVGSADNSTLTFNISAGDLGAVASALRGQGVEETDIRELEHAMQADPQPDDGRHFGPRVSEWMGAMLTKAASGAWQIGIDVAAPFLAELISQYYGFGT